jgi:hypothetical protein
MAVEAGDKFRLTVEWLMPELTKAYNVLGMMCTAGSATDSELKSAADLWAVTAYGWLAAHISDEVDMGDFRLFEVQFSEGEWETVRVLDQWAATFTPTSGYDMLPHAVAGVVTFPTANPKRRGRVFIPGLTEIANVNSLVQASVLTGLGAFGNDLLTTMLPGTANVSYHVLGDDGVARAATGYSVNTLFGSQRRRKPGIGV